VVTYEDTPRYRGASQSALCALTRQLLTWVARAGSLNVLARVDAAAAEELRELLAAADQGARGGMAGLSARLAATPLGATTTVSLGGTTYCSDVEGMNLEARASTAAVLNEAVALLQPLQRADVQGWLLRQGLEEAGAAGEQGVKNCLLLPACHNPGCPLPPAMADTCQLKRCSGCSSACYCSSKCQKAHWRSRHKAMCPALAAAGSGAAAGAAAGS
jgi:hypothetical protein